MIESNDISGEKMRMKETVEGEWPLGRRDTGFGDRLVGSALELGATWFCVIRHLGGGAFCMHEPSPHPQVRRAAARFIECWA